MLAVHTEPAGRYDYRHVLRFVYTDERLDDCPPALETAIRSCRCIHTPAASRSNDNPRVTRQHCGLPQGRDARLDGAVFVRRGPDGRYRAGGTVRVGYLCCVQVNSFGSK
jgi:hypothetical protein